MSWCAHLGYTNGLELGWWNYTHNTNRMIAAALEDAGHPVFRSWWRHLNGMTVLEGRDYLDTIIAALAANPDKYRKMNPDNGWGDYDSLLALLTDMRDAVPTQPLVWRVNG